MLVSVIIPTYNRLTKLRRVMAGLIKQTFPFDRWEVIVIDDGSADGTLDYLHENTFPFTLRILHQEHLGPWPARSKGVTESLGKILLFLDDDIYPQPRLIEEHVRMLTADDKEQLAGVRGHLLNWPERVNTPFLKYFDRYTAPNFFAKKHGKKIAFNFFACANQSVKKDIFLELGGFNPDFAGYGWADIELALRLDETGYFVLYNKDAVGYHDTSPTLESFCRREEINGKAANLFYQNHPLLKVKMITRRSQTMLMFNRFLDSHPWLLNLNRRFIKYLEKHSPGMVLFLSYNFEISYHYYKGMRQLETRQR